MSQTPGFEAPVHDSITEPILLAGVPRTLAIVLWNIAAALGFAMHQLWVVPVAIVLHLAFAGLAKRDPYFFDVLRSAIRSPKRLEP